MIPVVMAATDIKVASAVKLRVGVDVTSLSFKWARVLHACRRADQKIRIETPRKILATALVARVGSNAPNTVFRPVATPSPSNWSPPS
jgi:hypothetical protein